MDFSPHTDTLVAVVLGALLATVSGIAANQLEAFFQRRERERSAALLFGELMTTLKVMLDNATRTRAIGERYGPITRRMLHAARREIDIYDRHRVALLDLRDAALRVDIHSVMVRISMPLDGVLDSIAANDGSDVAREQGYDYMMEVVTRLPDLVKRLGRLAGHTFDEFRDDIAPAGRATVERPSERQT
jgi:hypothetical protein